MKRHLFLINFEKKKNNFSKENIFSKAKMISFYIFKETNFLVFYNQFYSFLNKECNSSSETCPFFSKIACSGSRMLGIICFSAGSGKTFLFFLF